MPSRRRFDQDMDLVGVVARRRRRRRLGKSKGRSRRGRLWSALTVFLVVLAGAAVAALVGAAVVPRVIESRCSLSSLKPVSIGTNSFVTASDDSLLGTIPANKNRQQLTLAQMSPWVARATVAI